MSYLEPAVGLDQGLGTVGVAVTSYPSVEPLPLGEVERSSPGAKRVASSVSETWASAPGVPREPPREG